MDKCPRCNEELYIEETNSGYGFKRCSNCGWDAILGNEGKLHNDDFDVQMTADQITELNRKLRPRFPTLPRV